MKKQKAKEDDKTKLILHFNIDKTVIVKNTDECCNLEYSMRKIICSQLWGKIEFKGETKIFKAIQELEFDSSKIKDPELITYLSFIEQEFPDDEEDEIKSKINKEKRMNLIYDVVEPNNPGAKMNGVLKTMKGKMELGPKICMEYNYKFDHSKRPDFSSILEKENTNFKNLSDETDRFNYIFKHGYNNIINSFFHTIIQLTKAKRRFVIIFRFFDCPQNIKDEFIFEFNSFCNGKHLRFNGQFGTLQKFEGSKNKDFRISETLENAAFFVRNNKNPDCETIIWEEEKPDEEIDDELRDHYEEKFDDEENPQAKGLIAKGYNDILLTTYEKLSQYCSIMYDDDSSLYLKTGSTGKLLIIDPYDYETLHILFDSNLDKEPEKVDIINIATGVKLNNQFCFEKYLVNVDPRKAIVDDNYFINKITLCEGNRTKEIEDLTKKEIPLQPVSNDFDLLTEIRKLSSDCYLERSIFPLLHNALDYVDVFRPNDPLIHIANYMLKNKDSIRPLEKDLIQDFNDRKKEEAEKIEEDMEEDNQEEKNI